VHGSVPRDAVAHLMYWNWTNWNVGEHCHH